MLYWSLLIILDIPGPALISSTTEHSTARGPTPTRSPAPALAPAPAVKPDYSAFSGFGSSQPTSKPATPQPSLLQQQEAIDSGKPLARAVASDPFAALATPAREATPQQAQPSMFDFGTRQSPAPAAAPGTDDDEWAFSSALPEGLPPSNTIEINNSSLNISLHATREPQNPSIITIALAFSSRSDEPISELTFMAAVTKVSVQISFPSRMRVGFCLLDRLMSLY